MSNLIVTNIQTTNIKNSAGTNSLILSAANARAEKGTFPFFYAYQKRSLF